MAHIRSTGRQFSRKTLLKQGLLSSKDLLAGLHQPGSEKWVVCDLYETLTFSKFKTIIFFKFLEAWQHRIHRQHQLWIAKYITVSHRKWLLFLEITLFWEEWNLALQGKHFNHKMKNVAETSCQILKTYQLHTLQSSWATLKGNRSFCLRSWVLATAGLGLVSR